MKTHRKMLTTLKPIKKRPKKSKGLQEVAEPCSSKKKCSWREIKQIKRNNSTPKMILKVQSKIEPSQSVCPLVQKSLALMKRERSNLLRTRIWATVMCPTKKVRISKREQKPRKAIMKWEDLPKRSWEKLPRNCRVHLIWKGRMPRKSHLTWRQDVEIILRTQKKLLT